MSTNKIRAAADYHADLAVIKRQFLLKVFPLQSLNINLKLFSVIVDRYR